MEYESESSSRTPKTEGVRTSRHLLDLRKPRALPGVRRLEDAIARFSPAERLALYGFVALLVGSVLVLVNELNKIVMVPQPARGGALIEGIIGTPRFANPLLAASDADRDVTALAYAGLLRAAPDGGYVPDMAASYDISEDGRVYTFVLREDAVFHDGEPVGAEDVIFTVQAAQDPNTKSPKRADWEGVRVVQLDERTVEFTLPRPYAPFLENTTLGILPKHLWENIHPEEFAFHQLNIRPIGSGPYRVEAVTTDGSGAPTSYVFHSFSTYTSGAPYIRTITFMFYPNEDTLITALRRGDVDSAAGITPGRLSELRLTKSEVYSTTLPRVFAVFFNQSQQPIFARKEVRSALAVALDKQAIINAVLSGYGVPLESPIPPNILGTNTENPEESDTDRLVRAHTILEDGGWSVDEETGIWKRGDTFLSFSLTTVNTPELIATAEAVADTWRQMGANVEVLIFSPAELTTNIIRPRNYDALLFGEIVGRTLDLFAFWHSTQRNDPGLNLALYTNSSADTLLSDARTESDREVREEKYLKFSELVQQDMPAIFLYAPEFIYVIPEQLKNIRLGALTTPADRFLNVYEWHVETENVWDIFSNTIINQ
jgi:peptide/nickel transport system substrate-binding protein